ncbi:hypothetical protein D9M72_483950 [compost metagenome]
MRLHQVVVIQCGENPQLTAHGFFRGPLLSAVSPRAGRVPGREFRRGEALHGKLATGQLFPDKPYPRAGAAAKFPFNLVARNLRGRTGGTPVGGVRGYRSRQGCRTALV